MCHVKSMVACMLPVFNIWFLFRGLCNPWKKWCLYSKGTILSGGEWKEGIVISPNFFFFVLLLIHIPYDQDSYASFGFWFHFLKVVFILCCSKYGIDVWLISIFFCLKRGFLEAAWESVCVGGGWDWLSVFDLWSKHWIHILFKMFTLFILFSWISQCQWVSYVAFH